MLLGLLRRNFPVKKDTLTSCLRFVNPTIQFRFLETRQRLRMNEAFVRYNEDSDRFDISFRYINDDPVVDRQYNFNRQLNEPIETFLKRIDANVSKTLTKKKKKGKKKEVAAEKVEEDVKDNVVAEKIKILRNNEKVDNSLLCKEILHESSEVVLEVLGNKYSLNVNCPWVESIKLPNTIMCGFPVYPSRMETLHMNKHDSLFTWFKEDKKKSSTNKDRWVEVATGFIYVPKVEDIGSKLKITCTPRMGDRSGPESEVESLVAVQAGPGPCPFETRHAFTKEKLSGKDFRVMSYNLLADAYADSDYSRETLFNYCPVYALDIDYRKALFIKEILGFNADIICLQEVDSKIFDNDLLPTLSLQKCDGVYAKKGEELSEGIAIFYNTDRLEKMHSEIIVMSKNLHIENFSDVWQQLTNEKTKERFLGRNTTVQVLVLKSKENPDNIFVVGNTHLYFHPDADHIRLLQGFYTLSYLQSVVQRTKSENPDCKVNMILCGDFNSVPECGIYKLYTQNHVPADFIDWSSNEEEKVENISLSQDAKIASACGTPEYTNYTVEFNGCLDYIFYETENLKVTQVIPMPSDEEVKLHQAIPSVVFPSDHIAICADLQLIT